MKTFTVVIADDHPIVLLGVRELVERDARFQVVGEAICSAGLIGLLEQQPIDIVITDYNMPGDSPYGDGLKLVEYLKRHFPQVQILILTMISNHLILTRLQEMGVVGVIQKSQLHTEIQVALKSIVQQALYRSLEPAKTSVVESMTAIDARFSTLSPKEFEILRLFISGKSVSDIARSQNRSSKTISAQKISAMRKLEVSSDQDLLAYCLAQNIFN
ncbi:MULTISPECIES: response regulator [Pseudomonas]|jgi:two-component system capsular synthesis response regulator RcsB|uniref:Response regulator n=1 Tax=Pseudomonas proteolytica TaxID=219574 RepID=A0AAP6YDQ7_9PSED|nr:MULTISPECIES: response regulator [Pseudomonas]TDR47961.1 LuxR family two component transcriptional regulator [Pseudomonas brenneri]VVN69842.1 Transcriptional regulatory protein RcsB [Pseudomonas fluorescens]KAA8704077.1 response regulator [Pseudomonas proteolytica]MCF5055866.1 response regulator [Pseudomonas proteolytica]MDF3160546.1 response regulator [Pseudomonas proteolytica]